MRLPDGRIRKRRRSSYDGTVAHALTFTTHRRQPFLKSDRCCQWLVDAIERMRARLNVDVWAYVFMPDHVHIVLFTEADLFPTARILAALKIPVSRKAAAYLRENAPDYLSNATSNAGAETTFRFWQRGGGYDRDLHKRDTIYHTIDYIHENPVRRGLVDAPYKWKWSSAAFYAGMGRAPITPDVASIPDPLSHWQFS